MTSLKKILFLFTISFLFYSCSDPEKQMSSYHNDTTITDIRFIETRLSVAGIDSLKNYFKYYKIDTTKAFSGINNVIPDAKTAADVAYIILVKIYDKETINHELPLRVTSIGSYWIISGTLHSELGGTAEIIMNKKNGTIVRLIHYK